MPEVDEQPDTEVAMYDPAKLRDGEMEILPPVRTEVERQVALQQGLLTEEETVKTLRSNASRAAEIWGKLLVRAERVDDKDLAATMRAVSDGQAKSVDALLKLTGRAPEQGDGGITALLRGLANDGLVKLHVDLSVGANEEAGGDER